MTTDDRSTQDYIGLTPTASGVTDPVIWRSAIPANAIVIPISAAASSAKTARKVGFEVFNTKLGTLRPWTAASRRA